LIEPKFYMNNHWIVTTKF